MKSISIYTLPLLLLLIFPACTEEPTTVNDAVPDKLKSMIVLKEGETETFSFKYQDDFITEISVIQSDGTRSSHKFFYDQGKLISKKVSTGEKSEIANFTYFDDEIIAYKFGTDSVIFVLDNDGNVNNSERFEYSNELQILRPTGRKEYEWADGNCTKITTLIYDDNLKTTVNYNYDTLQNPIKIYQGIPIPDDLIHDYELITSSENNVTSKTSGDYEVYYQYEYNENDFPSALTIKSFEVNLTDTTELLITFEY